MVKVGIAGVTGMTGEETLKILLGHPEVEITYLGSEHAAGSEIGDFIPDLKGICQIKCEKIDPEIMAKKTDVLLLCKEAGFGMKIAPKLLKAKKKVIDLGPDFRLSKADIFEKHYKINHTSKKLLKEAVYGLPELYRDKIAKANLVANPGCYPTGAILAVAPIFKEMEDTGYHFQDTFSIFISAYSGFSGSGKKYSEVTKNLFVEAYGNLRPYNVGKHRHQPEIEQILSEIAKREISVSFVPHTVPVDRGILSTIFLNFLDASELQWMQNVKSNSEKICRKMQRNYPVHSLGLTKEKIYEIYKKFYKDEPFIRILPEGEVAQNQRVSHTNNCEISIHPMNERFSQIVVISAIDNLVKGAAGQAVQNLNIMCGLDEVAGLQFRNI